MTIDSDTGPPELERAQEKVRCFFDVSLGGLPAGRIVFELFPSIAPKTCDNFRSLCTGEKGIGQKTSKPLHYKGIIFHRVVKDFMIQSGDFSNGNGTGGESIYGGTFNDESFTLKHDKAFLLSMANRGKDTNGSQFFITTQPAPHLDNVHVVFGHVVSGQDLVRQLEQLPVDRNSRPLQDAVVSNCGELIRQVKEKKEKKKKKATASSDESVDESSKKRKKDKKKKRERESSPRAARKNDIDSVEEGELEDDVHPMATVTKINPDEIPEVSNKYLMRGDGRRPTGEDYADRKRDGDQRGGRDQKGFGWSKKRVPLSRSGRIIKGRGNFRYRTPSRSRSRSRSQTPIHWRAAQKRTIKMTDLEKLEEEKRQREVEIKRREAERKKRHEELAKGASKKSFFELNQEPVSAGAAALTAQSESPNGDGNGTRQERAKSVGSADMNALDYEHQPAEQSEDTDGEDQAQTASNKKSETLAKALGVEPKKKANDSVTAGDDRRRPGEDGRNRNHSRSRSRERRRAPDEHRGRSPVHYRGGNRRPPFAGGGQHFNRYNPQRRFSGGGGGGFVGGSYYSRPARPRFGGNERQDRDRRRSRSRDEKRSRRDRSNSRSRSPDRRHRRRHSSDSQSSASPDRSRRPRSESPKDARTSRPARASHERGGHGKGFNGKEKESVKKEKSPGSVATAIVAAATAAVEAASQAVAVSVKKECSISEEEKSRLQKEKMLKRAETLLLLKSHMEKEIEEQQRKAREKQEHRVKIERGDDGALDAVMDLAQLKQLKKETLEKLNAQEAAQRILQTVVTNVGAVASASGHKKKSKASGKRRSSSTSSSSSSSSSASSSRGSSSKKEKNRKKRKEKKRKHRRHSSSSSS